jgi:hypothetical protein
MNDDLECAVTAAGCLANYLSNNNKVERDELTAGWLLLFIPRLQQAHEQVVANAGTANGPKQLLWLDLGERSCQCLVSLLEDNPLLCSD